MVVLSVFAKVMETVLHKSVYEQLRGWFCVQQYGFLKGPSTVSNLVNIITTISNELDSTKQVDVVYLDFQKTFNRIDCDVLPRKLVYTGFSKVLTSFLLTILQTISNMYITIHVNLYPIVWILVWGQDVALDHLCFQLYLAIYPTQRVSHLRRWRQISHDY